MLKLLLFILPLGLDTFAATAALGMAGLPSRIRLRVSLAMSSFEATMPIIGLAIGRGLGVAVGGVADYLAGGLLIALAMYVFFRDDADEREKVKSLTTHRGLSLLVLGISVSLDELAMGFTIGLVGLSIWVAVLLIAVQAFSLAQLGLRLGTRIGEAGREWAERLAAVALFGLGVLVLWEKLS